MDGVKASIRANHTRENVFRQEIHFHVNQNHFHLKAFARRLVWRQRHKAAWYMTRTIIMGPGTYGYPSRVTHIRVPFSRCEGVFHWTGPHLTCLNLKKNEKLYVLSIRKQKLLVSCSGIMIKNIRGILRSTQSNFVRHNKNVNHIH